MTEQLNRQEQLAARADQLKRLSDKLPNEVVPVVTSSDVGEITHGYLIRPQRVENDSRCLVISANGDSVAFLSADAQTSVGAMIDRTSSVGVDGKRIVSFAPEEATAQHAIAAETVASALCTRLNVQRMTFVDEHNNIYASEKQQGSFQLVPATEADVQPFVDRITTDFTRLKDKASAITGKPVMAALQSSLGV